MRRCSVKPYEGGEKYIFVSYSHNDKKRVFPVIEQLAYDGYRVWYDEGVDPGSEWPDIIARHLNGCAACIAFISENSLNSYNCRGEINFALLKKKPFITVVIEPVVMPLGMEMQLSATQAIFKYTLSTETEFFKKLYGAKFLVDCFGTPDSSVVISKPEDYEDDKLRVPFGESDLKRETFSEKWFINVAQEENEKVAEISGKVEKHSADESVDENKTVVNEPETPNLTPRSYAEIKSWLIRVKTNEKIVLETDETKLGRSETMTDYTIVENSLIGRVHAMIILKDNKYFIMDNNSKNKTFLNAKELEPKKEYELSNGDSIRLANEKFIFHQEDAER